MSVFHVTRQFTPDVHLEKWPYSSKAAFVITCDDVSSGYPVEYHKEILTTLEKYNFTCTFFVIPYHGKWDLLTDSPEHINFLHTAEYLGHEIALHGYTHCENEFVCAPEKQEEYLKKGLTIMEEAQFTVKGFRAPCLQTTSETLNILQKYNFVYDSSEFGMGEINMDGPIPQIPSGHEYTWYIQSEDLEEKLYTAQKEFDTAVKDKGLFTMVLHVKAVNEGAGMQFLDKFLSYVKGKTWNFTLIELVQWKKSTQKVIWESKKTLKGGEITFYNVPKGLVVHVVLPHEYDTLPVSGVVTTKTDNTFEILFDKSFSQVTLGFNLKYAS